MQKDIEKEKNCHNNLSQNSAMMDLLNKACSDNEGVSIEAQKKLEDWEKLGNKIYDYFAINKFKLINFIDGIDNMYWLVKNNKPREYFEKLIKSLTTMVENYYGVNGRRFKRLFLVFIRPETTEYIRSFSVPGNSLTRKAHDPELHECINSDYLDIINRKVSLLDQEISYFHDYKKDAGEAFDSLHKSHSDDATIPAHEISCWTSINKRRFKVLKDLSWVDEVKSLLENISEMKGPTEHLSKDRAVYRYEDKTALEDMSNNNLRSISFNMVSSSSYILKYFPELINKEEFAKRDEQHFDTDREFYNTRKRIVRRTLLTLRSHVYNTVRDADKSASFIPNIFWYSTSKLDKIAEGNEKKVWYGLTGLRLIQIIRDNSRMTRKQAVEIVHKIYLIPKEIVSASFDYLLILGMIKYYEISTTSNKADALFCITKKCDIVERIIFNYPDVLCLLAWDTPLMEGENRIDFKVENERYEGFLYSMISGYILMMSYMVKQNSLDMKRLGDLQKSNDILVAKYDSPEEKFDLSKKLISEPALCSIAGAYNTISKRNLRLKFPSFYRTTILDSTNILRILSISNIQYFSY